MGWSAPANHVYTVGELVTPATLNTYVKDNLIDLDRRTSPVQARVDTVETRSGGAWGDLTTVGPQVSVDIGQTGRAMVTLSASMTAFTGGAYVQVGYAMTGANTVAAGDHRTIGFNAPFAENYFLLSGTFLDVNLNPGVTTFTMKYSVLSGTGSWGSRRLTVVPFGS